MYGKDDSLTYCQTFPNPKYHNESCSINAECITNNCVNNTCVGKEDGQLCFKDYECDKQSYCDENSWACTRYATKNENCFYLECAFGYECVYTDDDTMKCLEQFSVRAGGKAETAKLCESLYSINGICYDSRMKDGREFKKCTSDSDCVIEIIDGKGNVIREDTIMCNAEGPNGYHCYPSSKSKQWKNYVKAVKEVRDNVKENKVHQALIMEDSVSFSSVLREAVLGLSIYNFDDCVLNTIFVLLGSGFIKVSFTLIVLLFAIIS